MAPFSVSLDGFAMQSTNARDDGERDDRRAAILAELPARPLAEALQLIVVLNPRKQHTPLGVQLEAIERHQAAARIRLGNRRGGDRRQRIVANA